MLLITEGVFFFFFLSTLLISGEGNGKPLLYSCLENPMDGGVQRNYKTLLKEIREDINGKTTHVHELKDLILLKHQYYSKQSTDLLQSLQKSQRFFFLQE